MDYFGSFWAGKTKGKVAATQEAGKSSTAIQGGVIVSQEQNSRLRGVQKYKTFENNAANIDIVFASLRVYMSLLAASSWTAEPFDNDAKSQEIADDLMSFIHEMDQPFVEIVKSAAMFKFNGFSWLEMTAAKRKDGKIGFSSIESRPCKTIVRWDVDDSGQVNGVGQLLPLTSSIAYIPRWKSIYLVENTLTDSPEGFGYFRSIAENCLSLQEIQISERMGVNRDLRGIPIGRAPFAAMKEAGLSDEQIEAAVAPLTEFVTLQQKGETTGAILESATYTSQNESQTGSSYSFTGNKQYDLELLQSQSNGLGDVDRIIRRKNYEIARSLGTEVLLVGDSSSSGSLALSRDKSANLLLAVNGLLQELADQFNKDLVEFIGRLNGWDMDRLPILTPSEVSQRSVEETIEALKNLAPLGIQINREDDAAKEIFRMLDLTPLDDSVSEEDLM